MNSPHSPVDALIIGGGLAGLCCAQALHRQGLTFTLFESAAEVGGRLKTDRAEGFTMDHGFQVFLTAYPEAQDVLDYDALELHPFDPGALMRFNGRFQTLGDPVRKPGDALPTLFNPIGSLGDKLRIARLRRTLLRQKSDALWQGDDIPTSQWLTQYGFSPAMIERFFKPFLGGVFLDNELQTSARMFRYLFHMFAAGPVTVPRQGMQAIPLQLKAALPEDAIRLKSKVAELGNTSVTLSSGERHEGRAVVVATDMSQAKALIDEHGQREWSGTTCMYFSTPKAPVQRPILVLNAEGRGVVNSMHVVSRVNPHAAPDGRHLVSVSIHGTGHNPATLEDDVRKEMAAWFGDVVKQWHLVKRFDIPQALPAQPPGVLEPVERPVRRGDGVYICGDHIDQASIQGAMVSGRRAAEAVIADRA